MHDAAELTGIHTAIQEYTPWRQGFPVCSCMSFFGRRLETPKHALATSTVHISRHSFTFASATPPRRVDLGPPGTAGTAGRHAGRSTAAPARLVVGERERSARVRGTTPAAHAARRAHASTGHGDSACAHPRIFPDTPTADARSPEARREHMRIHVHCSLVTLYEH